MTYRYNQGELEPTILKVKKMKKQRLTQERVRELFDYDEKTGVFKCKLSAHGRRKVGSLAGCVNSHGYLQITVDGTAYKAHRLAWLFVNGYTPVGLVVHHRDHSKTNNAIDNLQLSSKACHDRGLRSTNTSGYPGVSFDKSRSKWKAVITEQGVTRLLGRFIKKSDAVEARQAAELKIKNGETCNIKDSI